MITELVVHDPAKSCVPWWKEVKPLEGRAKIEFKPGLNILWGPNGCGKTTILLAIARMLHCEQGGRPLVTEQSVRAVTDFHMKEIVGSLVRKEGYKDQGYTFLDGVRPVHDGQGVLHSDPAKAVGLAGGSFDWDFIWEGIGNARMKGSAGEMTAYRMNQVFEALREQRVPLTQWTFTIRPANWPDLPTPKKSKKSKKGREEEDQSQPPVWKADPNRPDPWLMLTEQVAESLKGTLPVGQPTILLDEPDRSLSLVYQANLWWNLAESGAKTHQIIAAGHSLSALLLPGANYIDLVPGYLDQCLEVCRKLGKRFAGKEPS